MTETEQRVSWTNGLKVLIGLCGITAASVLTMAVGFGVNMQRFDQMRTDVAACRQDINSIKGELRDISIDATTARERISAIGKQVDTIHASLGNRTRGMQ